MMDKIYFGVFDYDGQPGVLLLDAENWEHGGCGDLKLTQEICNKMANIEGLEYVEETLWAWYEGTEEELHQEMIDAGFIYNEEVKKEGESILM